MSRAFAIREAHRAFRISAEKARARADQDIARVNAAFDLEVARLRAERESRLNEIDRQFIDFVTGQRGVLRRDLQAIQQRQAPLFVGDNAGQNHAQEG